MGIARNLGRQVGRQLGGRLPQAAPGPTASFVRTALDRAIAGTGPLPPAAFSAWKARRETHGDVTRAVRRVIDTHVRYAGVEGFATNLGGLVTAAVAMPASVAGLALIQCRQVACIAELYGHDLDDQRVRTAILVTLLGEGHTLARVGKGDLPGPPSEIATSPDLDPDAPVAEEIAGLVAAELITRATGTRMAGIVGRRVPVVGGAVGMTTDAYATWKVGRYADREFRPRAQR